MPPITSLNAWDWINHNEITLPNGPFRIEGFEWQEKILVMNPKKECLMKGTQFGGTTAISLKNVHGLIHGCYPQGVMYVFPTTSISRRFSQSRFTPLIESNPCIAKFIPKTDNIELKRVNKSNLYFVGGKSTVKIDGQQKDSAALREAPADKVVIDEVDLIDPDMVELVLKRLLGSDIQEESYLSTPSLEDFGIDKLYKSSDQGVWAIKCEKCGKYTCLELEFPECLHRHRDGSVTRICIKCRDREIYPRDGLWVKRYSDEEMAGYWISQLNSIKNDPKVILDKFENPPRGNLASVYNNYLAKAYTSSEDRLSKQNVFECCGEDYMLKKHDGPCAAGVDVQGEKKGNRVVIGCRSSKNTKKILFVGRLSSFSDIFKKCKEFNVKCAVFDEDPEKRQVKKFQDRANYAVYSCKYQKTQRGGAAFDGKKGTVRINRTEMCDQTHGLVMGTDGMLTLPMRNEEVEIYAQELNNTAKKLVEDDEKGTREYVWIKLGSDDYFHATNYFNLACERVGVSRYEKKQRTVTDAWAAGFEDDDMDGGFMGR